MKCILCGAEFPPAWVALPTKSGETQKRFPKEVCDSCADPKQRPAVRRSYPFSTGYMVLAGNIERLVIREYSHAYHKALEAMQGIDGMCTDEEIAFLGLHRRVYGSTYHAALTCGRINDLLDSTRREVQKSFPRIKGDGLERIRKRYQLYVKTEEETE